MNFSSSMIVYEVFFIFWFLKLFKFNLQIFTMKADEQYSEENRQPTYYAN